MKNTIQKTLFGEKMSEQRKEKHPSSSCHRCGRSLDNKTSIGRGYGPVCWRKLGPADMEREFEAAGIKRVPAKIAQEIFDKCPKKECGCGQELSPEIWADVNHGDGWVVPGFGGKPWLFIRCPKCHKDISLWKLGYEDPPLKKEEPVQPPNVPIAEQQ